MINEFLQNNLNLPQQSIHLLFSSNRWELRQEIMDLLKDGKNVVLDRYSYSGVAYSTAGGMVVINCAVHPVQNCKTVFV
jgi:dTMP kinase